MTRPSSRRATGTTLPIGTTLQVNLLPAEIVAARGVKSLKRMLAFVVLGFAALLALVVVYAGLRVDAAADSLAEEQSRTSRLLAEQARYREVTVVTERLGLTQLAYLFTSTTEVSWSDYLGYISATVPDDVTISQLAVTAASPVAGGPAEEEPLVTNGLGTITFTAVSPTIPDATAWSRSLAAVPGLVDPRVGSAILKEPQGGGTAKYETVVTVRLDEGALTDRSAEIAGS